MKERLSNVLKWFLMLFGVLFIIQLLILFGAVLGLVSLANADFSFMPDKTNNSKLKRIQPVIDFAQSYKDQNGVYPQNVDGVKVKKGTDYKYEVSEDQNCFTITEGGKNNVLKQYQRCSSDTAHTTSISENYVEYND